MENTESALRIVLDKEEYEQLVKSAGEQIKEFTTICDNIRDGVFKAAREKNLDDEETAVLFRTVLVKTAAENSQVRDLLEQVTAAFAPLQASDK